MNRSSSVLAVSTVVVVAASATLLGGRKSYGDGGTPVGTVVLNKEAVSIPVTLSGPPPFTLTTIGTIDGSLYRHLRVVVSQRPSVGTTYANVYAFVSHGATQSALSATVPNGTNAISTSSAPTNSLPALAQGVTGLYDDPGGTVTIQAYTLSADGKDTSVVLDVTVYGFVN